jgi:hypothetical protein
MAHEADRPPRGPVIDLRGRVVELSADGVRVRRADAVRVLMRGLREGRRGLALPTDRLSSGVGEHALPPVLVTNAQPVVIGRYSTEYRRVERARAHNIETAAHFLDGAVIAPYGRFSFNDRVGARDRSHGYREAHVILDGEMVDGIGGGVCQVASTLHAAAFLSGLEIAQHTPHSRPSEYIPMGLDATVVWPTVDLVIVNPFPFPVTVHAFADAGQMTVELFGRRRARRVDWRHDVLSSTSFGDRYVEDPLVRPGEQLVSQQGRRGAMVLRSRTIDDERGLRVEEVHIRYPPTDRIVRVAPGTLDPESGLPATTVSVAPLPENPFRE